MFLWVNLTLLNPIKGFSWRGCVVQATKNKEESCSFLDAIGRRSCGPLSGLAKNRHVGKPKLRVKRIETAGRYATVRFAVLSSHLHFNSLSFESRLSLLCIHIVGHATESEVHASGKFCSISDPPPPHSLSLSPACDQIREKESLLLNTTIRASKRKFAKCGGPGLQGSHSQHAVTDSKEKNAELFPATSSCVHGVLWISNDLRRVAALGNY